MSKTLNLNSSLSRRDVLAGGAAASAAAMLPIGLGKVRAHDPFTPVVSGPVVLRGKLCVTKLPGQTYPIELISDRITGYAPFYMENDRYIKPFMIGPGKYVRMHGKFRSDTSPVLVFMPDEIGSLIPLPAVPDFNGMVRSDPMTSDEEATFMELFTTLARAIGDHPDPSTKAYILEQSNQFINEWIADPSWAQRFDVVPFAACQLNDGTLVGSSMSQILGIHGDEISDECLAELAALILSTLLGLVFTYLSPRMRDAIKEEGKNLIKDRVVRRRLILLFEQAKRVIQGGGNVGDLVSILVDAFAAIAVQVARSALNIAKNVLRWWEAALAASTLLASAAQIAKVIFVIGKIAYAAYRLFEACFGHHLEASAEYSHPQLVMATG